MCHCIAHNSSTCTHQHCTMSLISDALYITLHNSEIQNSVAQARKLSNTSSTASSSSNLHGKRSRKASGVSSGTVTRSNSNGAASAASIELLRQTLEHTISSHGSFAKVFRQHSDSFHMQQLNDVAAAIVSSESVLVRLQDCATATAVTTNSSATTSTTTASTTSAAATVPVTTAAR
jgi:hypothetical protein